TEKERDVTRVITGSVSPTVLNLADAVDAAAARVRADHPDAAIETAVPATLAARALPEVEAALAELIRNALEHASAPDPSVEVSGARAGDEVTLTVRDEGPPIPESEYRVLTGEREMDEVYHGSGVGLWLVHWVVDLSSGRVEFTADDSGNTITVSLPASDRTVPEMR
ncbi:MAG: sensor histidine kinase, partial [Halorientalis sp.]